MAKRKSEKIYLSAATLAKYKAEYSNLINVERPKVQQALREARAQGDLSENAEYDAARDRQSEVEGRILELEGIIADAVLINKEIKASTSKAGIGATVKYFNEKTKKEMTVTIMGVHDSNPFENKISNESPVAKAIMDAKIGDTIEVDVPLKYNIKILDISYK